MPMENTTKPVSQTTPKAPAHTSPATKSITEEDKPVMRSFDDKKGKIAGATVFFVLVLMLALGLGAGYGAALISAKSGAAGTGTTAVQKESADGKTLGNGDTSVFKDTAEGVVKEGGVDGEGQYHLERPGGESQNVYLTSSSVDLSEVVGKKVKVWGQTQDAEKAGWLMDVGKVEIQ